MGKKQKKRDKRVSKGLRHQWKANQQIRRLLMKIARWKRNQSDPAKAAAGQSRGNWDTSGMESHLKILEKVAAKPAKRP